MKPYIVIIGAFLIVTMLLAEMYHLQSSADNNKNSEFDTASFQPILDHSKIPGDSVQIHDEMHSEIEKDFTPVFAEWKTNDQSISCDSLKKLNDSLLTQLFIAKYKVERVRYYVKICQRNPKQTKFLLSWVHRAVQ